MGLKTFKLTMKFNHSSGKLTITCADLINQSNVDIVVNETDTPVNFDANGVGTIQYEKTGAFCSAKIKNSSLVTGDDQRLGFVY